MLKQYPTYKYILALGDYSLLIISFVLAVWTRFYEKPFDQLLAQPRDVEAAARLTHDVTARILI